ncbi:MAG: hypothetical protein FWB72_05770 [Firmicutes bacterium]|nr:hypothetical protein [Bacillota bacterium]
MSNKKTIEKKNVKALQVPAIGSETGYKEMQAVEGGNSLRVTILSIAGVLSFGIVSMLAESAENASWAAQQTQLLLENKYKYCDADWFRIMSDRGVIKEGDTIFINGRPFVKNRIYHTQ